MQQTGATPEPGSSATEAADRELARGSARAAFEMGRQALAGVTDPVQRARAALVTGRAMLLCRPQSEALVFLQSEAAAALELGGGRPVAALMLAQAAASAVRSAQVPDALEMAERAVSAAAGTDERAEVLTRTVLASVLVAASRTRRGWDMLPSNEEISRVADWARDADLIAATAAGALVWGEELERAAELLSAVEEPNREAGNLAVLPSVLLPKALLAHRRCRWHEAEVVAVEAVDLARRSGQEALEPFAAALLSTVEAALGRALSCRARALAVLDSPYSSCPVVRSAALSALGLLDLGEGRFEASAHWFEVLAASVPGAARPHPGVIADRGRLRGPGTLGRGVAVLPRRQVDICEGAHAHGLG